MAQYKASQVAAIKDAIAEARQWAVSQRAVEPLAFYQCFRDAGGLVCPSGESWDDVDGLDQRIERALSHGGMPDEPIVAREVARIRREAAWASALLDDRVVGMRAHLGADEAADPRFKPLLADDRGLGARIFRRYDIVVPPPDCLSLRFTPVYEHELEW